MRSVPLGELLADLTRAFAASGAGIVQLPGGEPITAAVAENCTAPPFPWQQRPELLREVALSSATLRVGDATRQWLLTTVDGEEAASWLLWLHGPEHRGWSDAEAAVLTLTGQALARALRRSEGSPRWARQLVMRRRQQRFDEVATAARRIAHDYGNVLTGILGFSDLALSQLPALSPFATYLGEIHRSAQMGERLTAMLRLFTRRHWARTEPARLAAVVADEVRRLRGRALGSAVQVALPADLPRVAIDAEPLQHVLGQLFDNAAEAVVSGGEIRVSGRRVTLTADQCLDLLGAAEPGPYVEVAIEDTGCGLSADARQRLLVELFFSTKTRHRGYGLGVVHGILTAHRGALVIEPAEGGGTSARIYLPVAPAPTAEDGERVLVVDDDPMILQLVRTTLQRAGYRVETASSAALAMRSYTEAAEPFRLVLSDVTMPHVNGFDLVRQLQTHDASVNVLFMSGQVPTDLDRPPQLSGLPYDLLAKPFRPDGLLRAVRSALERGCQRPPTTLGTGDQGVLSPTR